MSNIEIITFGCRLNTFESEVMRKNACEMGLDDVIIFNTCAVTAEAERQVRQKIRAMAKKNPDKKIIVAGCAAQLHPEIFEAMPEVYRVLGNLDKLDKANLKNDSKRVIVSALDGKKITPPHSDLKAIEGKSKAFMQVQQGCNNRCTYCIVHTLRGNSISTPFSEIIIQAQNFLDAGYSELVLTGVDISAYGIDFSPRITLADLVKNILDKFVLFPNLRLRLSSLDPAYDYTKLLNILKNEPRLMTHFHFSAQSGDNDILKLMKRRHTREDVIHWANEIKKINPTAAIGADIITGFPGENDEQFLNSKKMLAEAQITHAHIFPFSIRPGTPSATMENQVPHLIAKERANILIDVANNLKQEFLKTLVGQKLRVLVEKNGENGYAQNYVNVTLDKKFAEGTIVNVQIISSNLEGLIGICLEN